METERIELSARERERLKVLHQVEEGHLKQVEAARRLRLTDRQVRRLQARLRSEGDRGIVHRLRGGRSNRKISDALRQRAVGELRQARYAGFGPTLAAEHLARQGIVVSRETIRSWMSAAELWQTRRRRMKRVHVWRPRRSCFGELVMMDSSPFRWLEQRGPACHLIAMIDDATSRVWGRLVEHDSTQENLRTLQGWLERHGRPLALYTDKNSLFVTSRPVQRHEQLRDAPARTQFGRALAELDIEWIAAHSPQAKGRVERLFGTLQDRLVKEMRLAGIDTLEGANRFLEITFWPFWKKRFTVRAAQGRDAHRRLESRQRLEQILSVRVERTVGSDHTVVWRGQRWGVRREDVCAGLRGARAEIEKRLDGTHWLRFRNRYLSLHACPAAAPSASPSGLRPPGLADRKPKPPTQIKTHHSPPPHHPWRKPWKRTFLNCEKPDISTLR
ncbi:MAG: ISNCY family transposase [Candidatus Acidiferrales bacterium]